MQVVSRWTARAALAMAVLSGGSAHALPLAGWIPMNSSVGADWSSDFGIDFGATPKGVSSGYGLVVPDPWVPPGEYYLHENSSYTANVKNALLGGLVSGTIGVDTGSYGAIGADVVHHYKLSFDNSNPAGCCGVGTSGVIDGAFEFDRQGHNANNPVPQYWVAEYTIDVVNPGTYYYSNFDAYFFQTHLLPSLNPATGRYTGTFSGSGMLPWLDNFCFGSVDECSRSWWRFTVGGGIDAGGLLGNASLDIDFAFAFSDTPFDHIVYPDVTPPPTGVPEPKTLAMFGAGLLALVAVPRMRRKA